MLYKLLLYKLSVGQSLKPLVSLVANWPFLPRTVKKSRTVFGKCRQAVLLGPTVQATDGLQAA